MPALSTNDAIERLAVAVEKAKPTALTEIYAEIFPEGPDAVSPSADILAEHVRTELLAEEIVDVWNVVFPSDRNVWYDEQEERFHYNEEPADYADTE